jgi:multiple sugar transport system permease protein
MSDSGQLLDTYRGLILTSSLNNLRGQFFTDDNLLSAGSIVIAIPVLTVFFVLQKQFVAGLTLGSTKG